MARFTASRRRLALSYTHIGCGCSLNIRRYCRADASSWLATCRSCTVVPSDSVRISSRSTSLREKASGWSEVTLRLPTMWLPARSGVAITERTPQRCGMEPMSQPAAWVSLHHTVRPWCSAGHKMLSCTDSRLPSGRTMSPTDALATSCSASSNSIMAPRAAVCFCTVWATSRRASGSAMSSDEICCCTCSSSAWCCALRWACISAWCCAEMSWNAPSTRTIRPASSRTAWPLVRTHSRCPCGSGTSATSSRSRPVCMQLAKACCIRS